MADKSPPKPAATLRAQIVRVWRWRAEVYPAPIAVAVAAWIAFGAWLTPGRTRDVLAVVTPALGVAVLTFVVLLVSIWWQRRRTRKETPDA